MSAARTCVSVVVVTYRSAEHIGACLDSLEQSASDWLREIVVVDNASPDFGDVDIMNRSRRLNVIHNLENLGFGRAVNIGARQCEGEYLLILNPDTQVESGAIAELVAMLDSRSKAAAVGPSITDLDGKFDYSARRGFPRPLAAFAYASRLDRVFSFSTALSAYQKRNVPPSREMMVDCLSGCCMLVRKEVFDRVGGFDEDYFLYGEDVDLCWKIAASGFERWYVPSAKIIHVKGASMKFSTARARREFFHAMNVFIDKRLAGEYSKLSVLFMKAGVGLWSLLSRR